MLIDISYSEYTESLPQGKFIVDNFSQVINYLSLVDTVILPTTETDTFGNRSIKDSMYNEVSKALTLPVEVRGATDQDYTITIQLKGYGIYEEEYKEILKTEENQ